MSPLIALFLIVLAVNYSAAFDCKPPTHYARLAVVNADNEYALLKNFINGYGIYYSCPAGSLQIGGTSLKSAICNSDGATEQYPVPYCGEMCLLV